ncbi:hypothetical protein NE237_014611 [Protea cynaroides]|uniref:Uncharacterized protein n=1 Tax=Protea cynaroides TaxID=273540 RepID=A0A9Q0KCG4_9MAGN|nr:hypothetical protein NE237_014611 [Protea cynaroides]
MTQKMKAVLSRMLSIGAPISVEEDDVEFSFAMEYGGPPVSYNLPRAAPIDIKRIPIAAVVAPASLSNRVSLPVVQPLLSSDPLKKKLFEDLTRGSEADVRPGLVMIVFEIEEVTSQISKGYIGLFKLQKGYSRPSKIPIHLTSASNGNQLTDWTSLITTAKVSGPR